MAQPSAWMSVMLQKLGAGRKHSSSPNVFVWWNDVLSSVMSALLTYRWSQPRRAP